MSGDTIGEDGTVRLHCYLRLAGALWFSAGCGARMRRTTGRVFAAAPRTEQNSRIDD
jgi:hypothetical protein